MSGKSDKKYINLIGSPSKSRKKKVVAKAKRRSKPSGKIVKNRSRGRSGR